MSVKVEALLRAVVAASRELLAVEFSGGLKRALQVLGHEAELDRVYVVRYDYERRAAFLAGEYCAPGIAHLAEIVGRNPHGSADYEEIWPPLLAGRSYSSTSRQRTGRKADLNRLTGVKRDLFVPVVVNGSVWGALGFDNCTSEREFSDAETEVLRSAAAVVAAALARGQADEERAGLAELLERIVGSARCFINETEFEGSLARWLGDLGETLQAVRATYHAVYVDDQRGLHTLRTLTEWIAPGVSSDRPVLSFKALHDLDPRRAEEISEALSQGRSSEIHVDQSAGPIRVFLHTRGSATVLVAPVLLNDRNQEAILFEFARRSTFNPAVLAALQAAADSVSATLKRNEAVRAALAEREARRAAEEARAVELAGLNHELELRNRLLDAAARASALLSGRGDFDAAVRDALGIVATAAGYDRVVLVRHLDASGHYAGVYRWRVTHEWVGPGLMSQLGGELAEGLMSDSPDFSCRILERDVILEYKTAELVDVEFREMQCDLGVQVMLAGNIWIDGVPWGAFSCDDCTRDRRRSAQERTLVATATRAIGQAVYRRSIEVRRDELQRQLLTEREQAAMRRAEEFARTNAALRRSTERLATDGDLNGFLCALMAEACLLTGAKSAGVFICDTEHGDLRMRAFMTEGREVDIATHPMMELWRRPVSREIAEGWLQATEKDYAWFDNSVPVERHPWPISREWHLSLGHRYVIDVPLHAGGELIGFLGQCFAGENWPEDFDSERTRILANHAALALQLSRLSQQARAAGTQAAVLKERNRLARDLHDTLAQGFAGIIAQLGALEGAIELKRWEEATAFFERAKRLARFSLAEARSSVHALRMETNAELLRTRLERVMALMAQGTGLVCQLDETGLPVELAPAVDWCAYKFVQEALSNAVKHADAAHFRVTLDWSATWVHVGAEDDGRGLTTTGMREGLGFTWMRERALECGGRFAVGPRAAGGTRLNLELPVRLLPR